MNVLFVCSGNVFRSMSAEYLMKKYLADHNISDVSVSSAGTTAKPQPIFPETLAHLSKYGCDASSHQQTKLAPDILEGKDIVICMSERHRTVVRAFGYEAILFNELAYGKNEDLMDNTEYGEKYGKEFELGEYVDTIVDYIHDAMPALIKALKLS